MFTKECIASKLLALYTGYILHWVSRDQLRNLLLANELCNKNIDAIVLLAYASVAGVPIPVSVYQKLHVTLLLNAE